MAARRVDVHRGLDAVVLQCVVVERAVYGRDDAVVVRKQQQGGRGFAAHAVLERVPCVGLRVALVAQQGVERPLVRLAFFGRDDRVEEDREGGFGAGERRSRGGEVTACRTAHDADLVRREARGSRFESHHDAKGLLDVLQRHFGVAVGHAVFEHGGRDAVFGEPLGHFIAFVVYAQLHVTAAGADYDGLSRGLLRSGREDVEHRFRNVGEAVLFGFAFGRGDAVAVGRSLVVPDFQRAGLSVVLCRCGACHKQKCCQSRCDSFHGRVVLEWIR